MRKVDLAEIKRIASEDRRRVWINAEDFDRDPKIYLHWSAGHYGQFFDDYHINIDADGSIYISTDDFAKTLAHTYRRNSGSVGVTLACGYCANTNWLGHEPPTKAQIETMAQVIAVLADALWLTIDRDHVMTHAEAADEIDGLNVDEPYGPQNDCERWDLQFLGTPESPKFVTDYDNPATGGNVLRGKANWYRNKWKAEKNA